MPGLGSAANPGICLAAWQSRPAAMGISTANPWPLAQRGCAGLDWQYAADKHRPSRPLPSIQKRQQGRALIPRQADEGTPRGRSLTAVPQDGLFRRPGPTIVQQAAPRRPQPEPPERRRAPVSTRSLMIRSSVGEVLAHVMQQQIGKRLNPRTAEQGETRNVTDCQLGAVAGCAAYLREQSSALAAPAVPSGRLRGTATDCWNSTMASRSASTSSGCRVRVAAARHSRCVVVQLGSG